MTDRNAKPNISAGILLSMGFLFGPACGGAAAQFDPNPSHTLNGWTHNQLREWQKQQRVEERARRNAERQTAAEERRPHPVSVAYSGTLTEVTGLQRMVSNKTLYLQTPIVAAGQLVKTDVAPVFFAADGNSYSPRYGSSRWHVNGSQLCFSGRPQPVCMTALSDSSGQAFLLDSANILMQVQQISAGDSARLNAGQSTTGYGYPRSQSLHPRVMESAPPSETSPTAHPEGTAPPPVHPMEALDKLLRSQRFKDGLADASKEADRVADLPKWCVRRDLFETHAYQPNWASPKPKSGGYCDPGYDVVRSATRPE